MMASETSAALWEVRYRAPPRAPRNYGRCTQFWKARRAQPSKRPRAATAAGIPSTRATGLRKSREFHFPEEFRSTVKTQTRSDRVERSGRISFGIQLT